jgi:hypothetical protein
MRQLTLILFLFPGLAWAQSPERELEELIKTGLETSYQLTCVDQSETMVTCVGPKAYGDSIFYSIQPKKRSWGIQISVVGDMNKIFLGEKKGLYGGLLIEKIKTTLAKNLDNCQKERRFIRFTGSSFERWKRIQCKTEGKKIKIEYLPKDKLNIVNGNWMSEGKYLRQLKIKIK